MFELHITSSKDIKNLNIEFTDGTIVNSKEKKETKVTKKENIPNNLKKSDMDIGIEDIISQPKKSFNINEIVNDKERPVKVAPELEGLDI